MPPSYYEILGVSINATEDEIRKAYRRRAKEFHPDLNKAPDAGAKFLIVKKAYETLINKNKRIVYNNKRKNPHSSYDAYMAWKKKKKEEEEREEFLRYQEFIRERERFRNSKLYVPMKIFMMFGAFLGYCVGLGIITICGFVLYRTHVAFVFLLLPFLAGGVYLIKCTADWYSSSKKYF